MNARSICPASAIEKLVSVRSPIVARQLATNFSREVRVWNGGVPRAWTSPKRPAMNAWPIAVASSSAGNTGRNDWGVQLGAYRAKGDAERQLLTTALQDVPQLDGGLRRVEAVKVQGVTIFRAQFGQPVLHDVDHRPRRQAVVEGATHPEVQGQVVPTEAQGPRTPRRRRHHADSSDEHVDLVALAGVVRHVPGRAGPAERGRYRTDLGRGRGDEQDAHADCVTCPSLCLRASERGCRSWRRERDTPAA